MYPHLVPIFSRVPYLDTEIFNAKVQSIWLNQRIHNRTVKAREGLASLRLKSEALS
jgi:hypothetical protein